MPFEPIPLSSMDLSVEKTGSTYFSLYQVQRDGYFKKYFSPDGPRIIWTKRLGLTLFRDMGEASAVWNLYYSPKSQFVFVVFKNGKVYKINTSAAYTDITGSATMDGTQVPRFAEYGDGSYIYICNGKKIGRYPTASGTGAYLADADAPVTVKSIVTINNTLVAQRIDSRRFDWSDAGDATVWSGLYANTESTPSNNQRMLFANNYLYFFKEDAVEVWRDDGTSFVRETQGSISLSTYYWDTLTVINGSIYGFDGNSQPFRINGFSFERLPNPFANVTYAYPLLGSYLSYDGKDFWVVQNSTGGAVNYLTWVFDIEFNQWYVWSGETGGAQVTWKANGIAKIPGSSIFVGGMVGTVNYLAGTKDLTEDIKTRIRTDFIDRGNIDKWKTCREVVLYFKRADTATTPKTMSIQYRDNGSTTFSTAVTAAIEATTTTDLKVVVRRLGKYKQRQWQFDMFNESTASLVAVWERYELGN